MGWEGGRQESQGKMKDCLAFWEVGRQIRVEGWGGEMVVESWRAPSPSEEGVDRAGFKVVPAGRVMS